MQKLTESHSVFHKSSVELKWKYVIGEATLESNSTFSK